MIDGLDELEAGKRESLEGLLSIYEEKYSLMKIISKLGVIVIIANIMVLLIGILTKLNITAVLSSITSTIMVIFTIRYNARNMRDVEDSIKKVRSEIGEN